MTDLSASVRGIKKKTVRPEYVPISAWLGHGPFAMWLVKHTAPRVIVELGSHTGYSYFSMCQAVVEAGLLTRTFAVDTWEGDAHAGAYGNEVYDAVCAHNAAYTRFSTLLRKRFDQALADVDDGSVDLLHVDGRHYYDDVKEDFESWIPKLSARAIVLFHDTEVLDRDFGVHQYWQELMQTYSGFKFLHSHGLGVMAFGSQIPLAGQQLFALAAQERGLALIRRTFTALASPDSDLTLTQRMLNLQGLRKWFRRRINKVVQKLRRLGLI